MTRREFITLPDFVRPFSRIFSAIDIGSSLAAAKNPVRWRPLRRFNEHWKSRRNMA